MYSVLKIKFKNNEKSTLEYRHSKGHSRKVRGVACSLTCVRTYAMQSLRASLWTCTSTLYYLLIQKWYYASFPVVLCFTPTEMNFHKLHFNIFDIFIVSGTFWPVKQPPLHILFIIHGIICRRFKNLVTVLLL